jgi:DNA-binding FadR family transcriptional regulator
MAHDHKFRATSKVFALQCECGVVYHDWLKEQLQALKMPASPLVEQQLRAELLETREMLEVQAAEITAALAAPKV